MGGMIPYFEGRVGYGWDKLGRGRQTKNYEALLAFHEEAADRLFPFVSPRIRLCSAVRAATVFADWIFFWESTTWYLLPTLPFETYSWSLYSGDDQGNRKPRSYRGAKRPDLSRECGQAPEAQKLIMHAKPGAFPGFFLVRFPLHRSRRVIKFVPVHRGNKQI